MVTYRTARLLRWLVAAAVGAVFVSGLFLHGAVGAVLLLLVAAGMAALTATTWAGVPARGRAARVVVLAVIVVVALAKLVN